MTKNHLFIPYYTALVGHYHTTPDQLIGKERLQIDQQIAEKYKPTDLLYLQASDNGMSRSGIQKGSKLLVAVHDEFTSTDLVVLTFENKPAIIRYIQEEDNHYITKPTNPDYLANMLPKENVQLFGIVLKAWQEISFDVEVG
ncbi:hypothetical protein CSV67_09170 [Sporosarcina sp. P2]|uniref:S24 family peptidase n=1 Tax=Sporosarcina sp. P2 TaxID=2048251 RepID=UPI000C16DEE4|nr:S24 family peptidase [Sporosarcina sp. P2]PID02462.1 hypothetical protein CSV67_09170 [Sporosarcina sp. P2]